MHLTVTLREELELFVREQIKSGRYSSPTDVVEAALFGLMDREVLREAKLKDLRAAIRLGLDSGPATEVGDMFERIRSEGRRRSAAKDAADAAE